MKTNLLVAALVCLTSTAACAGGSDDAPKDGDQDSSNSTGGSESGSGGTSSTGGTAAGTDCTAPSTLNCIGENNCVGKQICDPSGTYGPCICDETGSGGGATDDGDGCAPVASSCDPFAEDGYFCGCEFGATTVPRLQCLEATATGPDFKCCVIGLCTTDDECCRGQRCQDGTCCSSFNEPCFQGSDCDCTNRNQSKLVCDNNVCKGARDFPCASEADCSTTFPYCVDGECSEFAP